LINKQEKELSRRTTCCRKKNWIVRWKICV